MKQKLKSALGTRFGSVNSEAHITFNVFRCEDAELESRIKVVQEFCTLAFAKEIRFDAFGHYSNGAFFLSPDSESYTYIKYMMILFHKLHSDFNSKMSDDPHMSIGRQLTTSQLEIAYEAFATERPSLSFSFDRLGLRRFNRSRMQYDVVESFPFLGFEMFIPTQGNLGF